MPILTFWTFSCVCISCSSFTTSWLCSCFRPRPACFTSPSSWVILLSCPPPSSTHPVDLLMSILTFWTFSCVCISCSSLTTSWLCSCFRSRPACFTSPSSWVILLSCPPPPLFNSPCRPTNVYPYLLDIFLCLHKLFLLNNKLAL